MLETKRNSKLNFLDVLLVVVTFYVIAPIVARFISSYFTTYSYMIVALLATCLLIFRTASKSFNASMNILFPFLCWKFAEFLLLKDGLINWGYSALLDFLPLLIGYYFVTRCDDAKSKFFTKLIAILFVVTMITTIIGCIEYQGAARYIATVEDASEAQAVLYDWRNIGGYNFVYMLVLLHPLVILACKKGKIKGWIAAIVSVCVILLSVYAEYTTALLLTLLSCVLYFFKKKLSSKKIVLFAIFGIIAIFILSELLSNFLLILANNVGSETIANRLRILAGQGDGGMNDYKRFELYQRSLMVFLKNPIFGSFFNDGAGAGGHSFILDFMARYGLFGVLILVYMYKTIYELFIKPYKKQDSYGYIVWMFIQTLLLSTINTGMWLYVLAFFIPVGLKAIYQGGE